MSFVVKILQIERPVSGLFGRLCKNRYPGGYTIPQPIPDHNRVQTRHRHAVQRRRRVLIDCWLPCLNINIMRSTLHRAVAVSLLLCCFTLTAQEKGMWRAVSSNAKSITGDVALSDQKITINLMTFTMVRVRALDQAELSAAFDADSKANGSGSLYRLQVPASRKFLGKNSLCGAEDTEWMATYVVGHSLQLAFYSGQKPPLFALDALANSADVCGTYSYMN